MKILVFGANGKVGSLVVEELVSRGHNVTAFVHGIHQFNESDHLRVVRGDVYDQADVNTAVGGNEIVISTLGSWGTKRKDVLSEGMKNIIPAMKHHSVKRIITLTGSDALLPGEKLTLVDTVFHKFLGIVAPKILADGESHLLQLHNSDLDWTTVRSPVMKSGSNDGYILKDKKPAIYQTVDRVAVVKAMVDLVSSTDWIKSAPHIH